MLFVIALFITCFPSISYTLLLIAYNYRLCIRYLMKGLDRLKCLIGFGHLLLAVGQVPQTGLLLSDNGELLLKLVGSESIFVTHQLEIS